MPWKLVQKKYGIDPRFDARYHLKYFSAFLEFSVICSYFNESYRWVLSSENLGLSGIVLGESPQMSDRDASLAAIRYIRKQLDEKIEDLQRAEEGITDIPDFQRKK